MDILGKFISVFQCKDKMPCTNCMAEYSRTRKEHGCSKCAFSFCAKCVSKKFVIPVLSPKPVSVCDNCYNILTGKATSDELRNHKNRTPSVDNSKSANWWGDDKLPPPSMRAQYAAQKQKSTPAPSLPTASKSLSQTKGTDWESLEQRLSNLVRDLPASTSGVDKPSSSSSGGRATNVTADDRGKDVSLAEIEERLAALKEVPVELIRNPRLRIYDPADDNDDNTGAFNDEAEKLLAAAEQRAKLERRLECGYDNTALQLDDDYSSNGHNSDSSSTTRTSDSSLIRKTVNSALNAPSTRSSDLEDANVFHPNFAECIEQTIKDAESAERSAVEFIRQSQEQEKNSSPQQQQQSPQKQQQQRHHVESMDDRTKNGEKNARSGSAGEGTPTPPAISPANKVKTFFQRLLK